MQPFKSFWQRVTLCLPKGRLWLCLWDQSLHGKQWVTYKPASQLADGLIRQTRRLVSRDRLAGPATAGLHPTRSWRAQTLETWPSTVQLIIVLCDDRNMPSPWQTRLMVWLTSRRSISGGDFSEDRVGCLISWGLFLLYSISSPVEYRLYQKCLLVSF